MDRALGRSRGNGAAPAWFLVWPVWVKPPCRRLRAQVFGLQRSLLGQLAAVGPGTGPASADYPPRRALANRCRLDAQAHTHALGHGFARIDERARADRAKQGRPVGCSFVCRCELERKIEDTGDDDSRPEDQLRADAAREIIGPRA